jgi:hypothetical protein
VRLPDDRFKLNEPDSGGVNCLMFVLAAGVLAFLITLALYVFEVLK